MRLYARARIRTSTINTTLKSCKYCSLSIFIIHALTQSVIFSNFFFFKIKWSSLLIHLLYKFIAQHIYLNDWSLLVSKQPRHRISLNPHFSIFFLTILCSCAISSSLIDSFILVGVGGD